MHNNKGDDDNASNGLQQIGILEKTKYLLILWKYQTTFNILRKTITLRWNDIT